MSRVREIVKPRMMARSINDHESRFSTVENISPETLCGSLFGYDSPPAVGNLWIRETCSQKAKYWKENNLYLIGVYIVSLRKVVRLLHNRTKQETSWGDSPLVCFYELGFFTVYV